MAEGCSRPRYGAGATGATIDIREPRPGEILGHHYVIESELGRGGFGVVFKGRHLDIDRLVALKVLLATYGQKDPTAVDRFRREATIAASLNYPNTVRVFDYGETAEGVFYLVLEFVQGKDLAHAIAREGRIGVRRGVHITRQMLHAMMEAHARGIVHRDIKPDNVMLVPLGYDPDFVKVMDFGIAKMVTGGQALTQAGLTLGTPRYMPIEQLEGAAVTRAEALHGLILRASRDAFGPRTVCAAPEVAGCRPAGGALPGVCGAARHAGRRGASASALPAARSSCGSRSKSCGRSPSSRSRPTASRKESSASSDHAAAPRPDTEPRAPRAPCRRRSLSSMTPPLSVSSCA